MKSKKKLRKIIVKIVTWMLAGVAVLFLVLGYILIVLYLESKVSDTYFKAFYLGATATLSLIIGIVIPLLPPILTKIENKWLHQSSLLLPSMCIETHLKTVYNATEEINPALHTKTITIVVFDTHS